MTTPNAFRPARALILALAEIVKEDAYLTMSEGHFVGEVMRRSGGCVSPDRARVWRKELMREAGVGAP